MCEIKCCLSFCCAGWMSVCCLINIYFLSAVYNCQQKQKNKFQNSTEILILLEIKFRPFWMPSQNDEFKKQIVKYGRAMVFKKKNLEEKTDLFFLNVWVVLYFFPFHKIFASVSFCFMSAFSIQRFVHHKTSFIAKIEPTIFCFRQWIIAFDFFFVKFTILVLTKID